MFRDDFHRYLVRYIATGLSAQGIDEKAPKSQALHMTLTKSLFRSRRATSRTCVKRRSGANLRHGAILCRVPVGRRVGVREPPYYALELAVPADSPELQFYAAVPNGKRNLFEKQLLAIFPDAHLTQQPYDYNVFAVGGSALVSEAHFRRKSGTPIKRLQIDYDPLNAITNAFAKIEHRRGAALQLIIELPRERHEALS